MPYTMRALPAQRIPPSVVSRMGLLPPHPRSRRSPMAWLLVLCLGLGLSTTAATSLSGASRSAPAAAAGARMAAQADAGRALPRRIGQAGGYGAALAVRGSVAFFATGLRLRTADLRDPAQPRLLGESDELPDLLQDIALRDDIALVAAGNAGLWLLDVRDPSAPHVLGSLDTPGMARGVAVAGDLAYVADGPTGLLVVDISRPGQPRLLGMADTPGDAGDVLVRDGHVFVADWTGGLRVFNVADIHGPHEVATLVTAGEPVQLTLQGHLLFVAQRRAGLQLVDVSLPAAPRKMEDVGVESRAAAVRDSLAFVADQAGGLHVVDVSDPALVKTVRWGKAVPGLSGEILALTLLEDRTRLVALGIGETHDSWIGTIDISDPVQPGLNGRLSVSDPLRWHVLDLAFAGHYVCILDERPSRLRVVDLSLPEAPRLVGEVALPLLVDRQSNLAVDGRYAYVAVDWWLLIVDLVDPAAPTVVGEPTEQRDARRLAASDNHVYLAAGNDGLRILDVFNPMDPREVASISGIGSVYNVVVEQARAYVVSDSGLHVIDIGDPERPQPLGHLAMLGLNWLCLTVDDTRVFVLQSRVGGFPFLVAVDVADLSSPYAVAWIDLPVEPSQVVVAGGTAFVVDHVNESGNLWSMDLTQPESLEATRHVRTPRPSFALAAHQDLLVVASADLGMEVFTTLPPAASPARQKLWLPWLQGIKGGGETSRQLQILDQWGGSANTLALSGGRAYLGQGPRVQVFDLSQADSPHWLGESPILPGMIEDMAVQDGYAYVATGAGGLRVLDLTDDSAPREVGGLNTTGPVVGVAVLGVHAYMAGYRDLSVVDVTQPAQPREVARVYGIGHARALALAGDRLYVAMDSWLAVLDLSSPAAPVLLGSTDHLPGEISSLVVDGSHILLAAGSAGLLVIDVADPSGPRHIGQLDTPGRAVDVALAAGRAIVADQGIGLTVADLANPAQPVVLGRLDTLPGAYRLRIAGSVAYVADRGLGLRVVDLSELAAPRLLATLATALQADDLVIDGSRVYTVGIDSGLAVLDLSGPSFPRVSGRLPDARAWRIAVADGLAYLAAGAEGLQVIDVADPAAPRRRSNIRTLRQAYGVAVDDGFAYVADLDKGLTIVDVRDPDAPRIVSSVDTPGVTGDVALSSSFALLADHFEGGLRVIDVSQPTQPREIASLQTPGRAGAVTVSGNLALVDDGDDGLRVVDISDPRAPREVAAWDPEGVSTDIQLIGDRAYVAVGDWSAPRGRLQVLSLAVPQVPRLLASLEGVGSMASIAVTGQRILMAGQDGLWVIEEAGGGGRP